MFILCPATPVASMEEIWLPVVFPGIKWVISSHGKYRSHKSHDRIRVGHVRPDGRTYLGRKTKVRWLCYAFYPSVWMMDALGIKWEASHDNGIKTDDTIPNVRPVSVRFNRQKASKNPNHDQLDLDGKFTRKFPSVTARANHVHGSNGNIQACMRGRWPTAYGFKWRYADQSLPGEVWTDCSLRRAARNTTDRRSTISTGAARTIGAKICAG